MRKKILLTSLSWITILGSIIMAWYFTTGEELVTAITPMQTEWGITLYRVDILEYIRNIRDTLVSFDVFNFTAPATPTNDFADVIKGIRTIIAWLMYLVNWVIMVINILIFVPLRFILYIIIVVMTLMGLNGATLLTMTKEIYYWTIPYLQYSWLG